MESKNINFAEIADRVLEKIYNMSQEELLHALESCEDYSIGYAVWGDNGFRSEHHYENFHYNKSTGFSPNLIATFDKVNFSISAIELDYNASNDEFYQLAA